MEDKNNNDNKLSGAMKVAIFFGILGIGNLLLNSSSFIGIICLIICGFMVFANIKAKKNVEVANELTEVINSDSNHASDKELLTLLEDTIQSIKNNPADKDSNLYFRKMEGPNQFRIFASEAIKKGALVVLGTSKNNLYPITWHVFTNYIHASITGGLSFISESPDIFPADKYSFFRCQKTPIYSRTTYKTDASVGGRAVAGAALAGPVGAVVGAISAADKNNRGGVTKTKERISGYDYSIRFNLEDAERIYINTKVLGKTSEELQGFLNHNTKLIGNSDTIVLELEKNILNSDKMEKLAQFLTDIVKNLSQDNAVD